MKNCLCLAAAAAYLLALAGCNKPQPPQQFTIVMPGARIIDLSKDPPDPVYGVHFKVVDQAGLAGLQIHNWVLVFEGVPATSVLVGFNTAKDLPVVLGQGRVIFYVHANGSATLQGPDDAVWENPPTAPGGVVIWVADDVVQNGTIGDLKVSSWDKDSITVNGCSCKFMDGGKKLVCPDHTYQSAETSKIIVISDDGATREQRDK